MNEDFFKYDYNEPDPPKRDNLFVWTVVIILLIGLAFACWLGSFYLFGHPEKPDSYRILQKLHKVEPSKRFEITQAPPGEFLNPQKAYERYSTMSRFDLERENEQLLRDYIRNYQGTKRLVPYLTGRYCIMNSYELKPIDFFGSGVVALAQSVDFPQTLVEHVYTADPQTVPVLETMLATGLDIKLEKTMDLSAIIHVTRLFDGRLQFTVVPLLYGSYALKQGSGSFSLEPPATLNPAAGLPVVRGPLLEDAMKSYAEFIRKRAAPPHSVAAGATPAIPVAQPAAQTTIVRVDEPAPTPTPVPTPPAAVAVATPAIVPEQAEATPEPTATPVIATPTPKPAIVKATPTPAKSPVASTPAPTPLAVAPPAKVPLQPFLASAPTPGLTANPDANWRTYAPGKMPRGRLVTISDADDLAARGTGDEKIYLRGNFVVTAAGGNRAVLRSNSTLGNALASVTNAPSTRIIVEFPAGTQPPAERSIVSRDELRPFEVRSIQRKPGGQINIFVREVTAP